MREHVPFEGCRARRSASWVDQLPKLLGPRCTSTFLHGVPLGKIGCNLLAMVVGNKLDDAETH